MEDYKPNSNLSKEKQTESTEVTATQKIEPVINGSVKVKKRSGVKRMADAFIQEDAESVKSYIFMDILLPALKKAISDVVSNGVDMLLYGESGRSRKSNNNSGSSRISYRSYYDDRRDDRRDYNRPIRTGYEFDDYILETRADAETALDTLIDVLDRYGVVRVADYLEIIGQPSNYTDNKFGWTDLRNAEVMHARGGGFIIKLPRAVAL